MNIPYEYWNHVIGYWSSTESGINYAWIRAESIRYTNFERMFPHITGTPKNGATHGRVNKSSTVVRDN